MLSTMNSNNKHLSSSWSFLQSIKFMIDDEEQLSDFVRHRSVPHLALITKGHYGTTLVGAPDAENPCLQPYIYLHCKRVVKKLAGQLIRASKDGKALLSVTNLIVSVSDLFKGYFEILSEDGQPVTPKCIESVDELTELFPEQILVRKECKCYVPDTMDGELKHSDSRASSYNCQTLKAGTILTLVGRFRAKKQSFLRCYVDETGQSVFLKMGQKIKCSQIAQNAEIAGVHDAASLLQKRLPLTVRLVFGPVTEGLMEACARNNYHINSDGSGLVVRLRKSYRDQIIFGYSIRKPEGKIVALPLKTTLRLAPVSTNQQNQVMEHYDLRRLSKTCDDYLSIYADRINLIDQDEYLSHDQMQPSLRQKSVERKKFEKHRSSVAPLLNGKNNNGNGKICDEEIEQLYDYVRGLTPRKEMQKKNHAPPPPPISTIPNRTLTRMNERDNETYATSRSAPANPNVDASLGIARVFKTAEAIKENGVSLSNNNQNRKNLYKSSNKVTSSRKSPPSKNKIKGLTASMNDLQMPSSRHRPVEDDFFRDLSPPTNHIYRRKSPATNQNKRRPFSLSIPEISAPPLPNLRRRFQSPPNNDALRRSFVTLVTLDDKMVDIQNNVDRPAAMAVVPPLVKPMHIWATTIPPVAAYPYFPNGTKYVHCAPFFGSGQMGY